MYVYLYSKSGTLKIFVTNLNPEFLLWIFDFPIMDHEYRVVPL